MNIGVTSLSLFGLQSTDSFHVQLNLRIVMGQLVEVGFPLRRIIVSICNTRSVLIGSIADDLVETYKEVYTNEIFEAHTSSFIALYGCRIDNLSPFTPTSDQLSGTDRQWVIASFNTYNRSMNALQRIVPPVQPVGEIPNHQPVIRQDLVPTIIFLDFTELLKKIKRIEYDTTTTVGLCLLDTIEHMLPSNKNILHTLIADKMQEESIDRYTWLKQNSKFRSARYCGKFNNTRAVDYAFMTDWSNEYRNRDESWQTCIVDQQLLAITLQRFIHIIRIDSIVPENSDVGLEGFDNMPQTCPYVFTCMPYWDMSVKRNDCCHVNSGDIVNTDDIVLIYHQNSFFCTRAINEIDDEESSGSVSTDSPHSPDYSPPSSDVDEILGDGYSPPSQDLEDTHQTTSQGPPVNEEEKESKNSPPSQNSDDILPTTSKGSTVNEEEKHYLDVSSDNGNDHITGTNMKQKNNKISTTQNKESSELIPRPESNIKNVANGRKKKRIRKNSKNSTNPNQPVIPPKTKAPYNQRARKKMNRHEKRTTEDSERNFCKSCAYCGNDYDFLERKRITLSCHIGHVRTSYF